MTILVKIVGKKVLETETDDDIELSFSEENNSFHEEERPHLIFLIPGIRTDGEWAQELQLEAETWAGRRLHCKMVRGDGRFSDRLNTAHLVSRIGLNKFRSSFVSQIAHGVARCDPYSVNIIAHSMGSALLAEAIEEISESLAKRDLKLSTVALLGSVCHRRYSERIAKSCNLFVNDVGRWDILPFFASLVRPRHYSDVGLRGFLDGYVDKDRFFNHTHSSCTKMEHIKSRVLPLIETDRLQVEGIVKSKYKGPKRSSTFYTYLRRFIWVMTALLFYGLTSFLYCMI